MKKLGLVSLIILFVLLGSSLVSVGFSSVICVHKQDIPEFPLESYSLFEEKTFHVHDTHDFYAIRIYSNSTVSDFYFHYALMRISFYVNGTIGTTGVCNVTIPSEFMSTEFSIFKDEKPLVKNTDYTETFNSTHYLFTIKYEHSTHLIEIFANNKIPEFPSWTILPLFLTATLIGILVRKRLRSYSSTSSPTSINSDIFGQKI